MIQENADNKSKCDMIGKHIREHLGDYEVVLHEIVSGVVPVHIHVVPPCPERDYYILVTEGMSDRPMNTAEGFEDLRYAELVIALPSEWSLEYEALQDERYYWPIRILKYLACMPHEQSTWLGYHHTASFDEVGPLHSRFSDAILTISPLLPDGFASLDLGDKKIIFYGVVPLEKSELNLALLHGTEALARRMEVAWLTELLDVNRPSLCRQSDPIEVSIVLGEKAPLVDDVMHRMSKILPALPSINNLEVTDSGFSGNYEDELVSVSFSSERLVVEEMSLLWLNAQEDIDRSVGTLRIQLRGGTADPFIRSLFMTKIVLPYLLSGKDVLGVQWHTGVVQDIKFLQQFLANGEFQDERRLPALLWIAFIVVQEIDQKEIMQTQGMTSLGLPEIETVNAKDSSEGFIELIQDAHMYLWERNSPNHAGLQLRASIIDPEKLVLSRLNNTTHS